MASGANIFYLDVLIKLHFYLSGILRVYQDGISGRRSAVTDSTGRSSRRDTADKLVQPKPLYKVIIVLVFAGFMSIASAIFMWRDAFMMMKGFNHFLHYIVNVAGLSVLVWLSLALVGGEKIYKENKTRFLL